MKSFLIKITLLLFTICNLAHGQNSFITRQEKVVISNVPVFEGTRGKHGS